MFKPASVNTMPLYKTTPRKSLDMSQESTRFGAAMVAG